MKKIRILTYTILGIIYFYNVVIALIIYSPQFLIYLIDEHKEFLRVLSFLRKNIDLSRVLFLLLIMIFFNNRKKIKNVNNFYKLDRSTIINLNLIQILDFKEEQIIFKNKEYIYTSKIKLKELENNYLKDKKWNFLIF